MAGQNIFRHSNRPGATLSVNEDHAGGIEVTLQVGENFVRTVLGPEDAIEMANAVRRSVQPRYRRTPKTREIR